MVDCLRLPFSGGSDERYLAATQTSDATNKQCRFTPCCYALPSRMPHLTVSVHTMLQRACHHDATCLPTPLGSGFKLITPNVEDMLGTENPNHAAGQMKHTLSATCTLTQHRPAIAL